MRGLLLEPGASVLLVRENLYTENQAVCEMRSGDYSVYGLYDGAAGTVEVDMSRWNYVASFLKRVRNLSSNNFHVVLDIFLELFPLRDPTWRTKDVPK